MKNVQLDTYRIDQEAVEKIPKQIANRYCVIAIAINGSRLTVATSDATNLYALEDLRLVTNMQIQLVLAEKKEIQKAIDLEYSEIDAREAVNRANAEVTQKEVFLDTVLVGSVEDASPIVRLLHSLLVKGYNTNVSDIHIEPHETETVIRMRKDGMLLPYMTLEPELHQGIVARTKILAQMDITEKRRPQDGHFRMDIDEAEVNIRVSFVPTIYGEKGVLRFLNTNTVIDRIDSFGMSERNYEKTLGILKNPYGVIYLTGPTGSGKTTTLYSILEHMSHQAINIATIEDPIERSIKRLNQTQVNERVGVTFETGLRFLLRQDPDIIMVGETRDKSTAETSARAAITGHLVLSTLHSNNAVASVIRLLDMGLEPYMVAGSVVGIIAQRLVRKICPHCKVSYVGENEQVFYKGIGCHLCRETGYLGRVAIHEVLRVNTELKNMISAGKSSRELKEYAVTNLKLSTLQDEMGQLVLAGITSVEEMQKITQCID